MTQIITAALAAQMVREYNGSQFFSVSFIKRTDGTLREMVCRKGVSKFVKGGELKYDPAAKGLVGVLDVQAADIAKGYRMIATESIRSIKMNGNVFEVQ